VRLFRIERKYGEIKLGIEINYPGGLTNIRQRKGIDIFKADYRQRVLNVDRGNLIAYWPLDETAGVTANDISERGHDGIYDGPTLNNAAGPDGYGAPLFDGVNDSVNVYSAGLRAAWNGAAGTVIAWCKVLNVGVWTDGINRYAVYFSADGNNHISVKKNNTNNRFEFIRNGSGTLNNGRHEGMTTTDWFFSAITWSEANDINHYYTDLDWTDTDNGLGVWAGVLNNNATRIGRPTPVSANAWSGWLAHVMIWDTPLSTDQLMHLAVI
jgi:hypothetical protein